METIDQLKVHYEWNPEVEENLKKLQSLAEKYKEQFIEGLYSYLTNFEDTRTYLPDDTVIGRHREKLKDWFISLFKGKYDNSYLRNLYRIGEVHVKLGLPPHYVNASINFVRRFISDKLSLEFGISKQKDDLMVSVDKILDLNLDVLTSSYREEELKLYLASGKFQKILIENIRRVSWFFDFFIVLAFSLVGLFLIARIGEEIFLVLTRSTPLEKGTINILGSMLILYAVSELLTEGIKHIRGGAIGLKVFITVALAAIIRKVLILSLSPEQTTELFALALLLFVLGIIYWLIRKAEEK